jgi:predicted esterase
MDSAVFTFLQLRTEVFRRYGLQDWQGALNLVEAQASAFSVPAEAARILYWRACFLALLGRGDAAIDALEQGLARGYWWNPLQLRSDSDLATVQNRPEFVAIINESQRRNETAAATGREPLRLVTEPSAPAQTPYPLLLALHGYGNNAAETLPEWEVMAQHGWLVAALQSTQLAGMDGYHWMDETRAAQEVYAHVDALKAAYPVNADRIVIGGFSNGGRIALMLALTGVVQAQGVVSVGATLRDEAVAALNWEALRQRSPRLVIIVGALDKWWLERCVQQVDVFRANGLAVDLHIVPDTGHVYPADFATRLVGLIRFDVNRQDGKDIK